MCILKVMSTSKVPGDYYYGLCFFLILTLPSFLPFSPPGGSRMIHLCDLRKGSQYCQRWLGFPADMSGTFRDDKNGAYLCSQQGSHQPWVTTERLKHS